MPVKIACPNPDCDASYSVADEKLGRLGRCKKCGTKFSLVPHTRAEIQPRSETEPDSFPSPRPTIDDDLPSSFGRYEIIRVLGRGGMGTVYLAHDGQLDRRVALKVPHREFAQNPNVRERFLREARAAARFHHPNFCPIHDIGEVDGLPYLTMAYIEGGTLAATIESGRPWDQRKATEVVRQLALALAEAHRQGVVHRDLKPANVMIDARGGLVIMDFGLARRFEADDPTLTAAGAVMGTPGYMPPEQAEGRHKEVGPRSDIYSLGVILYELISGRRPFEGSVVKILAMILTADPPTPSTHHSEVSPTLEKICLKAMAKEIGDRHASMDEFAGALQTWLDTPVLESGDLLPPPADSQIGSDLPHSKEDRSRPRSPIRTWIAPSAASIALLLGIIIFVATDKGRIKIDVNDPNAVVHVDGEKVRIEGLGESITLRTGEHELSVRRGDIVVETRKFVVGRGENPALSVVLEPVPPKETPAAEPMPLAVAKVDPPPPPIKAAEAPKIESTPTDIPKPGDPMPSVNPPSAKESAQAPQTDETLVTNSIGMKLKLIPAGEFLMGSDESDPDARDDEKVNGKKHQVRITRPFYLGTTEVTVAQFRQFVEKSNYKTEAERDSMGGYGWNDAKGNFVKDPKYTWRSPGFPQADDHPVVIVSWNDAVAFCEWLSNKERQNYRLPTEAEWEYACRAGQAARYSSGDDPESLATVGNVADGTARERFHFADAIKLKDGFSFTAPVGQFRPNEFGLYDMHGNAWEWCADWYDPDYYSKSPSSDPMNSTQAAYRVFRGGSWSWDPLDCRSAFRIKDWLGYRFSSIGFRVARVR